MVLDRRLIRIIAVLLIAVSVCAALYMNYFRFQAEKQNKTVDILVDFDELLLLSKAQGTPLVDIVRQFKEAGATGVLMKERSLKELSQNGDVLLKNGNEIALLQKTNPNFLPRLKPGRDNSYIFLQDKADFNYLSQQIGAKGKTVDDSYTGEGIYLLAAHFSLREWEKLGLGFLKRDLEAVQNGGLPVVPRLREWPGASEKNIDFLIEELKGMPNISLLTFNDEVIPGSGNLPYLAKKIAELKITLGVFEFFPQQGLGTLALLSGKNALRVHAISENDMLRYNQTMALERYKLAVSERNIRVLYVRLFGLNKPDKVLDSTLKYITNVRNSVQEEGYQDAPAATLPGLPYSGLIMLTIGLGVVGAGMLIINCFLPARWTLFIGFLGFLGWLGIYVLNPTLARKAAALLSVIAFPIIAITVVLREEKRSLGQAVLALLQMSAISFVGALIMTGLLADKSFMLALDGFTGVKLAHILPLLLIPVYYVFKGKEPLKKVREILDTTISVKYVIAGLVILAAFAVYIIRTGNEGTMLVSSWEVRFRDILDQILGVRPRTKEFLFGYPVTLILLYYGLDYRKIPLLLLAIIGQVSLVNTYAHIHTPILISLHRSFNGLWLGIILGILSILIIDYTMKWLTGRKFNV